MDGSWIWDGLCNKQDVVLVDRISSQFSERPSFLAIKSILLWFKRDRYVALWVVR